MHHVPPLSNFATLVQMLNLNFVHVPFTSSGYYFVLESRNQRKNNLGHDTPMSATSTKATSIIADRVK
jgi:hypothetical protein